ncbi:MscL family protein, partial [Halomonas campaniensis]
MYYGTFIQNIIDFLIIAFVIFIIVRFVAKANALAQA